MKLPGASIAIDGWAFPCVQRIVERFVAIDWDLLNKYYIQAYH